MNNTETIKSYSNYAIYSLVVIIPIFFTAFGLRIGAIWLLLMASISLTLAFLARKEIKSSGGQLQGGWCAVIGAVFSALILVIFAGVIISKVVVTTDEQIFEDFREKIGKHLLKYNSENGCWPTTETGFSAMGNPPLDPWGNQYRYEYTGDCIGSEEGEYFTLYTLGKDQKKGGSGENSDYIYRSDVYGMRVNDVLKTY